MIEYFADGGPYEDAKTLWKKVRESSMPNYDKLLDIFQAAFTENMDNFIRITEVE